MAHRALDELFNNTALADVVGGDKRYIDGFTFAIASAPEIPMPEHWMPWVVDSRSVTLTNQNVDTLADYLMGILREHLDAMRKGTASQAWSPCGAADEKDRWLTGLLAAHQQLESVWQQAWDAAQNDNTTSTKEDPSLRLRRCLKLFSTLANPELSLSHRNGDDAQQLRDNLPGLRQHVPAMLNEYVSLAGELAGALPNQFETFVKPGNGPA